jgi:uncharacterized surface protein with fasciclin (FAS1) repeats
LNDRSEAEDVLQEVYLTVWQKAQSNGVIHVIDTVLLPS